MKAKEEFEKQTIISGLKLLHLFITVSLFGISWMLFRYGAMTSGGDIGYRYNYFIMAGYGVLLLFFSRIYNSYLLGYSRIWELIFAETLSQFFSVTIIYLVVSIGWNKFKSPVIFIPMMVLQLLLNMIWSRICNEYYFKLYPRKKTIFIYRNELDKKRFGMMNGKPAERLYEIKEELMYDGEYTEIKDRLNGYEAVFVAGVNSTCRNGILKYCKEEGIQGFFLPHIGDMLMQEAMHIQSFDSPILHITRTQIKLEYRIAKRLFDIVVSIFGIIILSPVMLITSLAIRLYDGAPAIYRQVRLTQDGEEFEILKFRSMRVDAERDGKARLSTGDSDDRVTPVGKVIRKCRLDELPQLFNILKGEMSIVGPRPERPEIARQYYETIPGFKLRLQVKAGLTGYAQVYGKYNTDPYQKLEFDLLYINNMNVLTDLKLMFATISILFLSESTTGVDSGQITARGEDSGIAPKRQTEKK